MLLALEAAGVVLTTMLFYHVIFVGPCIRKLRRAVGGIGDNPRLALEGTESKTEQRLLALERIVREEMLQVGFIRYNAFDDVAAELSYACAVLNGAGDGVVLSSLFSRQETRTFGKRVRGFVADQDASKEERDAITSARNGKVKA
jgi:Protein of unknown function (DUF4446)